MTVYWLGFDESGWVMSPEQPVGSIDLFHCGHCCWKLRRKPQLGGLTTEAKICLEETDHRRLDTR